MHRPTQNELLDLWDAASGRSRSERIALVLQCAWPGEAVRGWSLGTANARLLELRAALFGSIWDCETGCPRCEQPIELRLDIEAIVGSAPVRIATDGWHVVPAGRPHRFRVPLLADLACAEPVDAASADRLLAAILDDADAVHEVGVRSAVEEALLGLDPLASIDIVTACPDCGHRWRAAVEAIDMLWLEITVFAKRLLGDVARLAGVFGWTEQQVLALPPARRRHYLDLVAAW